MKIFAMEYNVISMRRGKNEKNYAKESSSACCSDGEFSRISRVRQAKN
jgi:hypothetical protein